MAKKLAVLEINNDWLKLAEIKCGKRYSTIKKLSLRNAGSDAKHIKQNLVSLIKESGIKTKRIVTYIPRYLLTVRNIELPSLDLEEIKNMVHLQIGKETPYARDEIISDYKIIGEGKQGFSKVMLVIIRKEIVSNYLDILGALNIKIDRIGFSSEGILNWYLIHRKEIPDKNGAVALCDIDYNFTDFSIIINDGLVFSRSISIGAHQLNSDSGMWQNKFLDELTRSIEIYQNEEMGRDISEVVLSGSENEFPGLLSLLGSELGINVHSINPLRDMGNLKIPESHKKIYNGISFSALHGLVCGPKPATIDLIPEDVRLSGELEVKAKDLMLMGVLFIFIISIIGGIFFKKNSDKELILDTLKAQLSKSESKADNIIRMMRINEIVEKRSSLKGTALEVFNELYNVVPNEFYFSTISFEENKQVVIRGVSTSMSYIFKFVTTLENLTYFTNVKTKYTTKRRVKDKELTDFEIICPIVKSE